MTTPIDRMIDASVHCARCGTPGFMKCDCHEHCSCGWIAERGWPCGNPETTRCSTKLKYRPLPEFRKGDRVRLIAESDFIPCDAKWSEGGYHGTVAATPRGGRRVASIRWDGRGSCDRIELWQLEKVG